MIRVIDAFSGKDVKVDQWLLGPDGMPWRLVDIHPGIFTAEVILQIKGDVPRRYNIPIRYLHPNFMLQRIVFIPN